MHTTNPVTRTRTEVVDLLGVRIRERKRKKGKRLGYLGKKELIAEVRKIFPNATVLPNESTTLCAPGFSGEMQNLS
jgi:hypothetical protein